MEPENTFGELAGAYASARPHYPAELYRWIALQCPRRERAWDCATGNGQAAVGLAAHFAAVEASDVSSEQIAHALRRPNVAYSVRRAEDSGFPVQSFDLVAVAQALHWLDFARFWPEVARVGRPGALFCAWGYAWTQKLPEIDAELTAPLRRILAPFWAPNNRLLWDGYPDAAIAFPWERIETPPFAIEMEWTLAELVAYVRTWSAFEHSRADPAAAAAVERLLERSRGLLPPERKLSVRMPLALVCGRIDARGA